jgi:hypothetical protein
MLVPLQSDVQPYALIMSLLVCAFGIPSKIRWETWLLAVAPSAALVIWLAEDQSFFGLRETLSFLSPLSIAVATITILELPGGPEMLRRFLVFATYCWLFFGLVERLYDPTLLVALIPNTSVDETRGVAGLATEPSFYGVYCLFLLLLNYISNNNNKKIMVMLLFQIFILAQSSVTILLLLVFIAYRAVLFPSLRLIMGVLFLLLICVLLFIYVLPYLTNLRIASLTLNLLSQPTALLQVDKSLNARAGHVLFSILGFIDNHGLPWGFDHFNEYVNQKSASLKNVWLGGLSPHMKIMSGYGAGLFELGILGLFIPLVAVLSIFRYFRPDIRSGILFALYISTIMFSAIQVSLPFFGVFLGWLLTKKPRPAGVLVDPS